MSTVFLFPGQGAQCSGMAQDLYEQSEAVRELFKIASTTLARDLADLLFNGSEDDLKSTNNTQVAMTLANISAAAVLRERGFSPAVVLGFSVGEYAALHEAGVLATETLFRIVAIRGEVMEKASRLADTPAGPSAMTAVLGLSYEEVLPIIESLSAEQVYVANHNSPTQLVLAGGAKGLAKAEAALSDAGAMKLIRLKVSGPFHSPLLASAREEFEKRIADLPFRDPQLPVISNVSARPLQNGEEARKMAGEQIISMVRWVDSEQYILDEGFITGAEDDLILEAGVGKVLCGLWRSLYKGVRAQQAGTLDAIYNLGT